MSNSSVAVVIEDDADVRGLLESVLEQAGFTVRTASNGREGVQLVRDSAAHVVTLDVGLPDIDGFEVLRRVRQFSDAYVLMLTGRSEESDMVTALHGGADDYIIKPFRPLELRARIQALMRRPNQPHPGAEQLDQRYQPMPPVPRRSEPVLRLDGLALNYETHAAFINGRPLQLTRSEFDLLYELLRASGAVRSRADLVRVVRGRHYPGDAYISEADERSVEVHIANLRRKLQENPETPRWLKTVRGAGYRLAPASPDPAGNQH